MPPLRATALVPMSNRPANARELCVRCFALIDQVEFVEFIPFRHTPALALLPELVKVRISPTHYHMESLWRQQSLMELET